MKILMILIVLLMILSVPAFAGDDLNEGYLWAKKNDIRDTEYSAGKSESFNAGVREYAAEQKSEAAGYEEQYERVPNTVEETRAIPGLFNEKTTVDTTWYEPGAAERKSKQEMINEREFQRYKASRKPQTTDYIRQPQDLS